MNEEVKKELFDNLLPKDDLNIENTPESNALKYALGDERIKNIGITGNYGSGKSSFLLSFIKTNNLEEKCVNISLASFTDVINISPDNSNSAFSINSESNQDEKSDNPDKQMSEISNMPDKNPHENSNKSTIDIVDDNDCYVELTKEQIQNIEISILHQLIYKHSIKDLPNSRIPRITGFSFLESKKLFKEIVQFLIFFFLFYFSIHFPNNLSFLKTYAINPLRCFLFLIGIIGGMNPFIKFGIWIILKIKNLSLKKLSFKNAEIELDSYKSDSILNQRLDEILYFFEQTDYEYVIFEDLDRFNNNQVFIHLREINKIVNDNNKINRDIKFIYAVKDQMFKNEERVKFFDFIIPIIPIINSSSAASELIKQSNSHPEYFKNFDSNYFIEIGSFINDMRLLKNILNEYYIYHDRLTVSSENNQKLFSLIVYKNLYPIDFSNMQRRKGAIQEVFDKKKDYISDFEKETNSIVNEHLEEIEKIKKENLSSIFELRIIFVTEYMHQKGFNVNSNQIYALCQTKFDSLMKGAAFVINEGYNGHTMKFDPDYFNKIRINDFTYAEREKIIINGIDKEIEKENNFIDAAQKELLKRTNQTVVELTKNNSGFLDDFKITSIQKYFLKRGFIDENYRDYISIFHEGVLTVSEYEYVMNVRNGEKTEYNTSINNVAQVLEKIKDVFINCTPALLNYDILNFLIKNEDKYKQQLDFLITYITEEINLTFLLSYILKSESQDFFYYAIINNNDFWDNIEKQNITTDSLNNICYTIIKSLSNKNFKISKINKKFISYVKEHSEILFKLTKTDDVDEFFNVLDKMQICFNSLNDKLLKIDFIKRNIFKNCCFVITYQNLNCISQNVNKNIIGIYSRIMTSEYDTLKKYIKSNSNLVCNELFMKSNCIEEEESIFIDFVNTINQTTEIKLKLLVHFNHKITMLKDIKNTELYPLLFENKKIGVSLDNILTYYEYNEKQIDDNLISFIIDEENLSVLANDKIIDEELIGIYVTFLTDLYQKEEINENIVDMLEKQNTKLLHDFDLRNISIEKLNCLIKHKSIKFSKEKLDEIRSINQDSANNYLKNNVENYLKIKDEIILNDFELTNILYSKEINDDNKVKVLENNIDKACTIEPKIELLRLIKKGNLFDKLNKTNVLQLLNLKGFEFGQFNKDKLPLKMELLLKTNEVLTDDEILKIIPIFDKNFSKIKSQHTVTIDNKLLNIEDLCEMLIIRGIIASGRKNNGKIVLRIK